MIGFIKKRKHRRGTAIVETDKGILLTAIKSKYLLPGGNAKRGESRFRAAIRELQEETGLIANEAKVIFRHESSSNQHTVVLIKARGSARPKMEVRKIKYYKPGNDIPMSRATKEIINKYYEWKKR